MSNELIDIALSLLKSDIDYLHERIREGAFPWQVVNESFKLLRGETRPESSSTTPVVDDSEDAQYKKIAEMYPGVKDQRQMIAPEIEASFTLTNKAEQLT